MILAVIAATVAQFVVGAVWYSALFGKLWGRIHGFDKLPKEVRDKMVKQMGPFYGLQALVTLVTSVVLVMLISALPQWSAYLVAALVWIGFVVPAQVSAVIFGGTEPKWIVKKLAVQAGASLACLEVAALVISILL